MEQQFANANFHAQTKRDGDRCCIVCNYYHQGTCKRFGLPIPNSDNINVCDEFVESEPINNLAALYKEQYALEKKIASYPKMKDAELEALMYTDTYAMFEYAQRLEKRGNASRAISCYEAAGNMGRDYAYCCGGVLAEKNQDMSTAARLYKKGYKRNEKWSAYRLGCMYYYGDIFAPFAKSKAEACFHFAALKGIPNAQAKYADILAAKFSDNPMGTGPDSSNFWLMCALLNGDPEAMQTQQRLRSGLEPNTLWYYDDMMKRIKENILKNYTQFLNK